jgi:nicotinate-nucleotide adenylyltransferase
MVRAAIAPYANFYLFDDTANHPPEKTTPNYAIETFKHLQMTYPDCEWYWLLGSDTFTTLPRWYQRQHLLPAVTWLVAPRGNDPLEQIESACRQVLQQLQQQGLSIRWSFLSSPYPHISSTQIRQAYHQSRSLSTFVPAAVRAYIRTHQLYE